jgi:hypothetical protein
LNVGIVEEYAAGTVDVLDFALDHPHDGEARTGEAAIKTALITKTFPS